MKYNLEIKTNSQRVDLALLEVLKAFYPEISRAILKTWFNERQILLFGSPLKGSHLLAPGIHEVTVSDEKLKLLTQWHAAPSQKGSFLPIIYEDESLLVLHKFTGVPSVPHDPADTETAMGAALAHFPSLSKVGRRGLEPGLVHRLDTSTSGLLVFAKTEEEFQRITAAWKVRSVQKIYRALITPLSPLALSHLKKLPFEIRNPLAHHAKSSKKMIVLHNDIKRDFRGKELAALTRVLSIRSLPSEAFRFEPVQKDILDLEIQIETGVMHQIRCHLSSINCPIVGDTLYEGLTDLNHLKSPRIWLHAWQLTLPLNTGATLHLEAALPRDWPASSN